MKYILTTLAIVLLATLGYSQNCTPSFGVTQLSSSGNNLLRAGIQSFSTPTTNHVKRFSMDWGDGTVVNSTTWVSSSHNYTSPGTYTVKMILKLTDSANTTVYCIDSATSTVTVSYQPCATTINASVNSQNNGVVTFTATTPGSTSQMTYIWTFGDGTIDTTQNPSITHTYGYSANFFVQLTAIDSNRTCSYSNYTNVVVQNGCGQANFSTNSNGLATNFYNTSSYINGYVVTSSSWDFGDGNTSTQLYALHHYTSSGTYNVQLITTWTDSATSIVYCRDTITKQVTVNGISGITGYIITDSTILAQPAFKVWLIKYDSSTQNLYAIDSLMLQSSSSTWRSYTFTGVPQGIYRVKAAVTNGPTSGTGYVPTYHDSDLLWSNASTINHTTGSTTYRNIFMRNGTVTSGPGFIAGNVTQGANKGTANGIADMPVYLLDANNELISYATTDGGGNFSFSNIPVGTYKVHPEEMNYNTIDALITISANSKSANVHFERTHANKTISPDLLSISNTNKIDDNLAIFPNPASKTVSVKWTGKDVANIILTDISGKQVMSYTVASKSTKQLDISKLSNGLYFITIESEGVKTTQKLLKQ